MITGGPNGNNPTGINNTFRVYYIIIIVLGTGGGFLLRWIIPTVDGIKTIGSNGKETLSNFLRNWSQNVLQIENSFGIVFSSGI